MEFQEEHRICRKADRQTSEERFVQNLSEGEIKLEIKYFVRFTHLCEGHISENMLAYHFDEIGPWKGI